MANNTALQSLLRMSVVKQIIIGLILGVSVYAVSVPAAKAVGILGSMFVGALKAVAPF